jgi:hypothetical protein
MVSYKNLLSAAVAASLLVTAGCGSSNKSNDSSSSSVALSSSSVAASSSSAAANVYPAGVVCVENTCTLKEAVATNGTKLAITESFTMDAGKTWQLEGTVRIGTGNVSIQNAAEATAIKAAGVTLTIEPGVSLLAKEGSTLIITRGSKIEAVGTAVAPITFSSVDNDFDGEGEWKGLVIQGFAPFYGQGGTGACFAGGAICNGPGEGGEDVGFYGGTDPADDSGTLKYVRIAEAGFPFAPDVEINSLTLMGVGHGTQLDYINIHNGLDDGIEWFGGTANLTHAVLTNIDDDDIDFDFGYQGNMQYILVRKSQTKLMASGSNDPRGIEANSNDGSYVPETKAVLSNVTLIGSTLSAAEPGMRLRGQVNTHMVNTAVSAFKNCVRVDIVSLTGAVLYGSSSFTNFLGACDGAALDDKSGGNGFTPGDNFIDLGAGVLLSFNDFYGITNPEAKLLAPVATITPVDNGSGFTFESTDYIGAVDPDATSAWWDGWIIEGTLD